QRRRNRVQGQRVLPQRQPRRRQEGEELVQRVLDQRRGVEFGVERKERQERLQQRVEREVDQQPGAVHRGRLGLDLTVIHNRVSDRRCRDRAAHTVAACGNRR